MSLGSEMEQNEYHIASRRLTQSGRVSRAPERFIEVERNGYGLAQVGRLLDLTQDEQTEVEDHVKGKFVYLNCLKPEGWAIRNSNRMNSDFFFMFLAPRTNADSAVEGIQKFYNYEDIWQKWKSDDEFRKMYPGGNDAQETLDEFLCPVVEPNDSEAQNATSKGQEGPTPGVPIEARVSVRILEEEDSQTLPVVETTGTAQGKRARSHSKSRPKKKRTHNIADCVPVSQNTDDTMVAVSQESLLERSRMENEREILLKAIQIEKLKKQLVMLRNADDGIAQEKKMLDWDLQKERRKQNIAKLRDENEKK